MPVVMLVAVRTLDKDSVVTQTFRKHFSTGVGQKHALTLQTDRHAHHQTLYNTLVKTKSLQEKLMHGRSKWQLLKFLQK